MIKFASARVKSATSRSATSRTSSLGASLGLSDQTQKKIVDAFKLAIIATPPISAVVALSVLMILQVDQTLSSTGALNEFLGHSQLLNRLINALQRERGMTCVLITRFALQLSFSGTEKTLIRGQLDDYRRDTNAVIDEMRPLWSRLVEADEILDMRTVESFTGALSNHRNSILNTITTCPQNIDFYTPRIDQLIYNTGRVFYDSQPGRFWGSFDALRMMLVAEEMFGLKRATGGSFFSQGYFDNDLYKYFMEINGAAEQYLELASMADREVKTVIDEQSMILNRTIGFLNNMTTVILSNSSVGDPQQNSINWFQNMTVFSDQIMANARSMLTSKLSHQLEEQLGYARGSLYVASSVVALSISICVPLTIYYGIQNNRMQQKIRIKIHELAIEKSKSENILFQMMPKSVVKEMQAGRQVLPRMYTECTIYFSDIVGFTDICSTSSPFQVVDLLNFLYIAMDTILDQYGVYKVETIGDAYLVVSGIPNSNGHDHSSEIATLALHMLKEISKMTVPHRKDQYLRMRIGLNTGPCATGIVGLKMPRYCLFGDTVNIASRMESTGLPMRIQITESTCRHLAKYHSSKHYCTPLRGKCAVKGKGTMNTYWLKSKGNFPYEVDLSGPDPDAQRD